jgi:hypothetical protein
VTIGPAYAAGQEEVLGTLKAGKFADVVILDQNPLEVNPDSILGLSVLMTMVGGKVEFCREGNESLCPAPQTTSVERHGTSIPSTFSLKQNYPNPFNPSTSIGFDIAGAGSQPVTLQLFDASGRRVRVLVDQRLSAGSYTISWNGRDEYGRPASSGAYFYRLKVGEYVDTKRLNLVK